MRLAARDRRDARVVVEGVEDVAFSAELTAHRAGIEDAEIRIARVAAAGIRPLLAAKPAAQEIGAAVSEADDAARIQRRLHGTAVLVLAMPRRDAGEGSAAEILTGAGLRAVRAAVEKYGIRLEARERGRRVAGLASIRTFVHDCAAARDQRAAGNEAKIFANLTCHYDTPFSTRAITSGARNTRRALVFLARAIRDLNRAPHRSRR